MSCTPQNHAPIPMRRVSHGKLEQRGDYYLCYATEEGHHTAEPPAADAHPTALVLAIPIALPPSPLPSVANGRRDWVYSRWPIAPETTPKGHSWDFDGDQDAPTLAPSLHAVGCWHGWVRAGQLEEA